jgi:two-component system, LuxR family, response regulator FixJ
VESSVSEGVSHRVFLRRDCLAYVVDADRIAAGTLATLFRLQGFRAVTFPSPPEVESRLERSPADIVIIAVRQSDDVEAVGRLRLHRPELPLIALIAEPSVDLAVAAMKAGADDAMLSPPDTGRLLRNVLELLHERAPASADRMAAEEQGFAQLTPREQEVLQLITSGQSNKEAGRRLGISPRTVEVHRARVMEKLGAKNTADLMRIVLAT